MFYSEKFDPQLNLDPESVITNDSFKSDWIEIKYPSKIFV